MRGINKKLSQQSSNKRRIKENIIEQFEQNSLENASFDDDPRRIV